jgi:hypothetical protein
MTTTSIPTTPPIASDEDTMTTTPSQPGPDAPRGPAAGLTDPSAYEAPMPTERTIRQRTSLPIQAYRFAAVSLKMTRMILRSHG